MRLGFLGYNLATEVVLSGKSGENKVFKYTDINRLLLIFFLTFFFILHSAAQPFAIKHIGQEEGLPSNSVVSFAQDAQGCLWMATESGLTRFDGHSFTAFTKNNSDLISNELNALLYDATDNQLWIGSQRDGISILDCATLRFRNLSLENGDLITNDVVALAHASDGGIWITHYHYGVEHYDRKTGKMTRYDTSVFPQLATPNWTAVEDGRGNLFLGHVYSGLSVINLKTKTVKNFRTAKDNPRTLPGNSVYSLCIDSHGNLWAGTNNGLALFNPQTEDFTNFSHNAADRFSLVGNRIYNIREMRDGRLWIAADIGGVSILDLGGAMFAAADNVRFQNIVPTDDWQGLSSANVRRLFQDYFGNIWIGTKGQGIDFISHTQPPFNILPYTIRKSGQIRNKPVLSIFSDKNEIYLGSENELAVFGENRLLQTLKISDYLGAPTNVIALTRDSEGYLWLGLYGENILRLHPRTRHAERIMLPNVYTSTNFCFFEEKEKMWIASNGGIFSYKNGILTREDSIWHQLYDHTLTSITRDGEGNLWVGTFGRGICIFDRQNRLIKHLGQENGFCSNAVYQFLADSTGCLWVATRNGLAYFPSCAATDSFAIYNQRQGLNNEHIYAIEQDRAGNIWMSTDLGISCWERHKQTFFNYDYRDGVVRGNFDTKAVCRSSDGDIYFGSTNGCCYFRPEEIGRNEPKATAQILECSPLAKDNAERSVREMPLPLKNGKIDLPYNQNSFSIRFSVADFSLAPRVEYVCMLEGLEHSWYNTQGANEVAFRHLAPGNYTFHLKARLRNDYAATLSTATLSIRIRPPFYLTWYAKLLYFILIAISVWAFFRSYRNKLRLQNSLELERRESFNRQALNEERLRFYTNITHELRTPLTLILGPLEDLSNEKKLPAAAHKKIGIIHASARQLLELINQILEFRKTETQNRHLSVARGNLNHLITEIVLRYKELNRNERLQFELALPQENVTLRFDSEVISVVLNNLLSNAVKYTPSGKITVSLTQEGRFTCITVADTGYGISQRDLPHIFDRYFQAKTDYQVAGTGIGLALVKSLATLHEGEITAESIEGQGTTFRFKIVTENLYPNALHKKTDEPAPQPASAAPEDETSSRPLLLVVEDNADIREYIVASFEAEFRVIAAKNGTEGLEQALQHIPNIIVSDIMMPEMDGYQLTSQQKSDFQSSHIPVILLTAHSSLEHQMEGIEAGADAYVTKPFSVKYLKTLIIKTIEQREKLRYKFSHEMGVVPTNISNTDRDNEFIRKVHTVIEQNIDNPDFSVDNFAQEVGLGRTVFYKKLKMLTGCSPNEYLRIIRLKKAAEMINESNLTIAEIAYQVGFNDPLYFSRCFKEQFGITPTHFKRQ